MWGPFPGELHPDLQAFLEREVPKSKKKVQVILGVGDYKLGSVISDTLGISCQHSGVVVELTRGEQSSATVGSWHLMPHGHSHALLQWKVIDSCLVCQSVSVSIAEADRIGYWSVLIC